MVNKIIQYNLHWHALAAGLLFLAKAPLYDMLCQIISFTEQDPLYHVCQAFFYVILFIAWLFAFTVLTLGKLYEQKTAGRNLLSDTVHYKMNYFDLVDKLKDADHLRLNENTLPKKHWTESSGMIFGKTKDRLICYEPDENGLNGLNAFVFGSPGDGKTSTVMATSCRQLGMKLTDDGQAQQHGACMVLDMKGDIYEINKEYRNIKRFSTIDYKGSCHYDPLESVRNADPTERPNLLENLAITLIPNDGSSGDGQYFIDGARDYFTGITLYMLENDINTPFPEIAEAIVTSNYQKWVEEIMKTDSMGTRYTNQFFGQNPKNVSGCFGKLVGSIRIFCSEPLKTLLTPEPGNNISYQDLENNIDVYIQIFPSQMQVMAPVVSLLFQDFMSSVLKRKEHQENPILFCLDEFPQLNMLPVVEQSAALFRAFNASLLFACQSISQIDKKYGIAGRKALLDCCKVFAFLSISDVETRSWASDLIGRKKELKVSQQIQRDGSTSKTISHIEENIIPPADFGILAEDDEVVISFRGRYIRAKKTYFFKD